MDQRSTITSSGMKKCSMAQIQTYNAHLRKKSEMGITAQGCHEILWQKKMERRIGIMWNHLWRDKGSGICGNHLIVCKSTSTTEHPLKTNDKSHGFGV